MCFVWIWEQTAIISLYSINWLVFITETECVYCAVRTGSVYLREACSSSLYIYTCCHYDFITSRYIELKLNGGSFTAIQPHKRAVSCCSRRICSCRQQRHLFMILSTWQSVRSAVFLQSCKSPYIFSFESLKEKCFFLSGRRKTSRAHKCWSPVAQALLTYVITGCFFYGFPVESYIIAYEACIIVISPDSWSAERDDKDT